MKKGFSLVELAIVLVIIGILIGMTIKGKSMIDLAELRSEVVKIHNIQIAVNTYNALNDKYPSTTNELVDNKILNTKDITIKYANMYNGKPQENIIFMPVYFAKLSGMTWYFDESHPNKDPNTKMFAIGFTKIGELSTISARMLCGIESILDDKTVQSGRGRGFNLYDVSDDFFDSCINKPKNKYLGVAFYAYVLD